MNCMESSNVCVINTPGEEKEWGRNCFPKLTKDIKPQIQEILTSKQDAQKSKPDSSTS